MITVASRQSILDIAIQHCGSVEAAFQIALLNNLALTDELVPGQQIEIPAVVNSSVVQYYEVNNIQPATALTEDETPGGIGYWIIELDFEIQ